MPKTSFTGPTSAPNWGTTDMENQVFTPPTLYANYRLNKSFNLGFGVYTPFGLGTKWAENWVGHYISEEINLTTFDFNPNLAWRINDQVALAGGLAYRYGTITMSRDSYVAVTDRDVDLEIEGSGSGFGWDAGLLIKPLDNLSLALSYRSRVTLEDLEGTAKFSYPSTPEHPDQDAFMATLFPELDLTTDLKLPEMIMTGVEWSPLEGVTLEGDFNYTGWAVYDTLTMDFQEETDAVKDSSTPKEYQSVWNYRFGLEYQLNNALALRAGFYFDATPIQEDYLEPSLPGADRNGYSFGFGYDLSEQMTLDAYFLYLKFANRTSTFAELPGYYESSALLSGFSFSYRF